MKTTDKFTRKKGIQVYKYSIILIISCVIFSSFSLRTSDPSMTYSLSGLNENIILFADGDGDGVEDDVDNCPLHANSDQLDTDSDGIGDVCDTDDDNDGVLDGEDTDHLNPNLCRDQDGDGCDDCYVGTDGFGPLVDYDTSNDGADADGDGLCDSGDNCLLVANAGQSDGDGDGVGDACDICPGEDDTADTDGDGTLDCIDDDLDGFAENDGDCDDTDNAIYPGAEEYCDAVDNDCDGDVDESGALDAVTWYADGDGDSYGDPATSTTACSPPPGYVADDTDCDDMDDTTYPGAEEYCDAVDNDCDGEVDESDALDAPTWYADMDGDSYGDPLSSITSCYQPSGYVSDNLDCDDNDDTTYPGAEEYCDAVDNDCDGDVDESGALDAVTWYADGDGDSYGDPTTSTMACSPPPGYVADDTDCDDLDDTTYPGADELPDGADNDCDGTVDEVDTDGDGVDDSEDADDDNDGVPDGDDANPLNPDVCRDLDFDGCDDCYHGTDDFGPLADYDTSNDGMDNDGDGECDAGDADDDNDGVPDVDDSDPLNPDICQDLDGDGCDDCSIGTDDFGSLADYSTEYDGTDTDGDGECDAGDADDDNDGVLDGSDPDPLDEDSDNDGISDGDEISYNTDPLDADTDDDGILDGDEIGYMTDPLNADSDGDELSDGLEMGVSVGVSGGMSDGAGVSFAGTDGFFHGDQDPATVTDPLDPDTDNDGICDGPCGFGGVCIGGEDRDENGAVNGDESDPLDADTDEDGIFDGEEDVDGDGIRGPDETYTWKADTDGDGLTDGIERGYSSPVSSGTSDGSNPSLRVSYAGTNLPFTGDSDVTSETDPLEVDTDNDGLTDGDEDIDLDGLFDTGETDPLDTDSDEDGISDGDEISSSTDPLDADSDDDGLSDGLETGVSLPLPSGYSSTSNVLFLGTDSGFLGDTDPASETDPLDVDTDNDGLSDGEEDADIDGANDSMETDPLDADTDNDGISDGDEIENMIDPMDADSDDDGLTDGLEMGVAAGLSGGTSEGTGISYAGSTGFVADSHSASVTDPLDPDTDNDGLSDSDEDINADGANDSMETDPLDADTDDDGISDGDEITFSLDPLDADSDDDGLTDGIEKGVTIGLPGGTSDGVTPVLQVSYAGTAAGFIGDSDTASTTDPLDEDTDDDGYCDGDNSTGSCVAGEDMDLDGQVDAGESDPNIPDDADQDGFRVVDGDCDDNDELINPLSEWYPDIDGDGYGICCSHGSMHSTRQPYLG